MESCLYGSFAGIIHRKLIAERIPGRHLTDFYSVKEHDKILLQVLLQEGKTI